MAKPTPSQNTQWVACANANFALTQLSSNLAAYLAQTVDIPLGEDARGVVTRLLALVIQEHDFARNFTDLKRSDYDPDAAQRIALEAVGDAILLIRRNALHEFR